MTTSARQAKLTFFRIPNNQINVDLRVLLSKTYLHILHHHRNLTVLAVIHFFRAGNSLIWYPSESLVFFQKWANEQFAQKNERFTHRSFLVSEMSDSLTSLISSEQSERIAHGRSFLVSEMSDSFTSLISSERPEWIAHGCSFPLSNLSDSLTVAHLSWAIWVNPSQLLIWFERNEQMREWANERIPSPVIFWITNRAFLLATHFLNSQ